MIREPSKLDEVLRSLGHAEAQPPSRELTALVSQMAPVALRRPWRPLRAVVGASLVILAIHVHTYAVRPDLAALPRWWLWAMGGAWFAVFFVPLAIALVPPPRAVLVDARLARIAAIGAAALAILFALFLRIDAPPATIIPVTMAKTIERLEWCLVTGLEMSAIPFALGALALRSAPQPLSSRWIGAALGAASGALACLMLHLQCNVGGELHAGLAHASQVLIGAVGGALLLPHLIRQAGPTGE